MKRIPFEVWMGYMPRAHQPLQESRIPELEERRIKLKEIREAAIEAMKQAQQSWVKETKHRQYKLGEKVWLEGKNLTTFHPNTKLQPKRFGPFTITKVVSPTTYRLDLPAQWKIHNAFHGALLNPYAKTREHGPNFVEPPPELVEGEPEYEVENLLRSRRRGRGRKLEYLVRWKGYAPVHDSWEPVENLHAPELVKEFHERELLAIRTIRMEVDSPVSPRSPHPAIELPLYRSERSPSSMIEPPLAPPMTPIELPYIQPKQYFVMLPLRLDKPRTFKDHREDSPKYRVRAPMPELMLPPVLPLPVPRGKAGWPQAKFLRPRPENCSMSDDAMESALPLPSPPPEACCEATTPLLVTAGLSDPATELGMEVHETPATHLGPPWF